MIKKIAVSLAAVLSIAAFAQSHATIGGDTKAKETSPVASPVFNNGGTGSAAASRRAMTVPFVSWTVDGTSVVGIPLSTDNTLARDLYAIVQSSGLILTAAPPSGTVVGSLTEKTSVTLGGKPIPPSATAQVSTVGDKYSVIYQDDVYTVPVNAAIGTPFMSTVARVATMLPPK